MFEEIKKAKNVGIIIRDDKNKDAVASAIALFLISKNINKSVHYKINKNSTVFPEKQEYPPKIVLTFEKELSDLFYEKEKNKTRLFLTPKDKNFSLKDLNYELVKSKREVCCDLIIAIGFKNFRELEIDAQENFESLYGAKIINIDNNHLNKRFGAINIIENGASISKIVFNNLKNYYDDDLVSTIFLSQIKQGENITKNEILNKGGDIASFQKIEKLISVLSTLEDINNIYLSEINTDKNTLVFVINFLKNYLEIPNFMLLLNKRDCISYFENNDYLELIKNHFQVKIKNKGILFSKQNLEKQDILKIFK